MSTDKWTKILTLEITIFGLKMMVKSSLEKIIFKFHMPTYSLVDSPLKQTRKKPKKLYFLKL